MVAKATHHPGPKNTPNYHYCQDEKLHKTLYLLTFPTPRPPCHGVPFGDVRFNIR